MDLEAIGGWVLVEESRRSEWRTPETAEDAATRAMVKRRRDFELMLGDDPEAVSDEQRMRARELADAEPMPDNLTSDQMRQCFGRARYL